MNDLDDPLKHLCMSDSVCEDEDSDKVVQPLDESFRDLDWYYADNGFRSREAMDLYHEPILELAAVPLSQAAGNVLDLGCGNGVLVEKICRCNHDLIPWGVDRSRHKIAHARLLFPRFGDNFVVSNIFNDCPVWSEDHEFQLVCLMLGRLIEVTSEQAKKLLKSIRHRARNLLVYVYEGFANQPASLEKLARRTGVTLSEKLANQTVALVDLGKV